MPVMRAKMKVSLVEVFETGGERLHFNAVSKPDGYPADGLDEDNTFAKWSPSADLHITVMNPALFGKFSAGDVFYVDFTKAE